MTYYLVSSKPGTLDSFQKRIPVLAGAGKLTDKTQLVKLLDDLPPDTFFLVDIKNPGDQLNEMVLTIRDRTPSARVIYVIEDNKAHNLRVHQSSPVGGDAYVQAVVHPDVFNKIVEGLCSPDVSKVTVIDKTNLIEVPELKSSTNVNTSTLSAELDQVFLSVTGTPPEQVRPQENKKETKPSGDSMGLKNVDLTLGDLDELDFNLDLAEDAQVEESGLDLDLGNDGALDLGDDQVKGEFDLDSGNSGYSELSLDDAPVTAVDKNEATGTTEFSLDDKSVVVDRLDLAPVDAGTGTGLSLANDSSINIQPMSLDSSMVMESFDLSEATRVKLKEIDELMDQDASQMNIHTNLDLAEEDLLDLGPSAAVSAAPGPALAEAEIEDFDIDFKTEVKELSTFSSDLTSQNEATTIRRFLKENPRVEEKPQPGRRSQSRPPAEVTPKEAPAVFTGDYERTHATIANLRADREELLAKIQKLEDDKVTFNRQTLSLRAELDETKIILTITRKKTAEEINELKNKLSHFDEKKQILEEKNRNLTQELEKAGQKTRIDVKKVQLREKELEQKLELLKSDAETQVRHRDLKILELKRKIDAMEFDMESISTQEKRSVESRYELEDKLEKAIKTLKGAISVLEEESDRSIALNVLKKNIDV
ncbi:MAG TPA: hypothetical protein VNJ01_06720 [Bacteriovoracaceae bacterium]|nr:hypothetical protein [Bacteriovoracaceae bacterium]